MKKAVNINPFWLNNEEKLMKRLHDIISGSNHGPFKSDSGLSWQLDGSSDWWAQVSEGKLILTCRYPIKRFETFVAFCKVWFS